MTVAISTGFNNGIKEKLLGFEPTLSISAPYSYVSGRAEEYVTYDDDIARAIHSTAPDAKTCLAIYQPAILKTKDDFAAIVLRGYGADYDTTFLSSNIIIGRIPDFGSSNADTCIVISSSVADRLGLRIGDHINTCFFIKDAIKARRFTISAIYDSGFGDFDETVAYGNLHTLQELNDVGDMTGTIIEIYTPGKIDRTSNTTQAHQLQQLLADNAVAHNSAEIEIVDYITNSGALYLNWLDLIDTNVIVIFILMCLVASLTLISSLFIIILDRIPTIGLLRAMGASGSLVRDIFLRMALRLVGTGIIIGNIIALGTGLLQQKYQFISLDPEMYYLSYVPFMFNWGHIIAINIGIILLSWAVLFIPARMATRISPARTMRYE